MGRTGGFLSSLSRDAHHVRPSSADIASPLATHDGSRMRAALPFRRKVSALPQLPWPERRRSQPEPRRAGSTSPPSQTPFPGRKHSTVSQQSQIMHRGYEARRPHPPPLSPPTTMPSTTTSPSTTNCSIYPSSKTGDRSILPWSTKLVSLSTNCSWYVPPIATHSGTVTHRATGR